MDYFEKLQKNPYQELSWNVPEQKQGRVNIIGGNKQNFHLEIKIAEFLEKSYPIKEIDVILPDALKNKLPPLPNIEFLPSSDSGSFKESQEFINIFNHSDFNLVIGDLSKNSVTGKALSSAVKNSEKMTLITRDGVDLFADNISESALMNENLILFASMPQLQKVLKGVYYPKMLLLSQSLVQVTEVLHKFTLSFPVSIITLHSEQILIAKDGLVKAIPLEKTDYSPMTLWGGELSAKIVAMNLFNPNKFIESSVFAIFG